MRPGQGEPLLNEKYQLLGKQLGEGGLGKVFLAQNIETGERVAVKHTLKTLEESELVRELAKNEVHTLLQLQGTPHILQIKDYFQRDNRQFIVTELCQGGTLSTLIKKRRITYDRALDIIRSLLKGYIAMNKCHILHRDLKPSNILFTKQGQLKIADFGFANTLAKLQKQGTLSIGSSLYMAPESLSHYHYSPKSDIWAIGVIFYQIVTGKHPWYEKTKPKILRKIMLQPIETLLPQKMDGWIKDILLRALDSDVLKRATAQELLSLVPQSENIANQNIPQTGFQQTTREEYRKLNQVISKKQLEPLETTSDSNIEIQTPKITYTKQKQNDKANPTKKKGAEKITKVLLHQIDYCRLQYELLKTITALKYSDSGFHKFVIKNDIQNALWINVIEMFNKIEEIRYDFFTNKQIETYRLSHDYTKIAGILGEYRTKYQESGEYSIRQSSQTNDSENKLKQTLIWLHENVSVNSPYRLFVLYDYLITLKWLFDAEKTDGAKDLCEVRMGDLVTALRKQLKARNKTIREDFLTQLEFKLEQLHVITRA